MESNDFEQYFARKVDKIADDAVRLLDTDLKNGTADIFLLTDNVYAISNVGKTYNWIVDGWDDLAPERIPEWYTDKEIWREADKKMPRGYKMNVGTSDILTEKKLYELRPVAEAVFDKRIKIDDPQHLNNALKFAAQLPKESQRSLGNCFDFLKGFLGESKKMTVDVYNDFVPHSFYFVYKQGDKFAMNGGIILHGFGETFSVELPNDKNYPHWSVHT